MKDELQWKKGENDEQHYWTLGEYDIIQLKEDMKRIFMVKWIDGRGEKGSPAYQGHYKSVEDAKNFENGRHWRFKRNVRILLKE